MDGHQHNILTPPASLDELDLTSIVYSDQPLPTTHIDNSYPNPNPNPNPNLENNDMNKQKGEEQGGEEENEGSGEHFSPSPPSSLLLAPSPPSSLLLAPSLQQHNGNEVHATEKGRDEEGDDISTRSHNVNDEDEYDGMGKEVSGDQEQRVSHEITRFNKLSLFIHRYKYELYCTMNYFLIYVTFGISLGSLGPALKVLQLSTNTDTEWMGLLFVSRGIGFVAGSMFIGKIIDFIQRHLNSSFPFPLNLLIILFSPHRIPFYFILLSSLCYLFIAFCTNFWLLNSLVFLTGFSGGILDVCNNTYLMWAWREKSLTFLQLIHFGFGLGAVSSGLIFGTLQYYFSEEDAVKYGFILIAVVTSPCGLGIYFISSPSPTSSATQTVDPSSSSNQTMADEETSPSYAYYHQAGKWVNEKYSAIMVVMLCGLYLFIYVGNESGYAGWIYSFSRDMGWGDAQESDYLTSAFWASFAAFRFIFIFISTKITASFTLIVCTSFCFLSSLFLLVVEYLFYRQIVSVMFSKISLWIVTICLGMGTSACYPSCIGLPQELGKTVTATSTSIMVFSASLGELVCAIVIAVLYSNVGPYSFPAFFVVLFSLGIFTICAILFTGNVPLSRWFTVFHSYGSMTIQPPTSSESIEIESTQSMETLPSEERTFRKLFNSMKGKFIEDESDSVEMDSFDERKFQMPI